MIEVHCYRKGKPRSILVNPYHIVGISEAGPKGKMGNLYFQPNSFIRSMEGELTEEEMEKGVKEAIVVEESREELREKIKIEEKL